MPSVEEHLKLGDELWGARKFDLAAEHYRSLVSLDPHSIKGWLRIAGIQLAQGDYEGCLKTCQHARTLTTEPKELAKIMVVEGRVFDNLGKFDLAEQSFRASLEIFAESPRLWCDLASVLDSSGRHQEAIEMLDKAISLNPKNWRLAYCHAQKGESYRELEMWDDAKKAYERAIQLEPTQSLYHSGLGRVLRDSDDLPGAVEAFNRAISLSPEIQPLHILLGDALEASDEMLLARESFQKAILLDPDNHGSLLHEALLGVALTEMDEHPEIARDYLLRAIEVNPSYAYAYSEMGKLEASLENNDAAEYWLRKACATDPDNEELRELLADFLAWGATRTSD